MNLPYLLKHSDLFPAVIGIMSRKTQNSSVFGFAREAIRRLQDRRDSGIIWLARGLI